MDSRKKQNDSLARRLLAAGARVDPFTEEVLETGAKGSPLPRGSGRITTELGSEPKKEA